MLEHLICDGLQDKSYCWRFHEKTSSLHNLVRKNIDLDDCYGYHDDMHDMLNENSGFVVSENLDGNNTYSQREG